LKYFDKTGDNYIIRDEIKSRVEFMQHNLLKDRYPDNCDLIICRNVLIYFTEDAKQYVFHNFNKAMKSNGILFVGSTEQIIAANNYCFAPVKTFFYKKTGEIS
jgi:chemotaxis protein methyltransferase CheR